MKLSTPLVSNPFRHAVAHVLSVVLIVASFSLLIGCQPTTSSQSTVSFAIFGDPAELAAYERLVAEFERQYPQIKIEIRHTPSPQNYRQKIAAGFATGDAADVMLLNYRRFAQFADQGGLQPLDSFFAEDDQIDPTEFFEVAIRSFEYEGQLWCVPQNVSSLVVYYNKDLFDAAGLPYPDSNWSREEFVATAIALTAPADSGGNELGQYGLGIDPNLFRLAPFVWQDGGRIVDDFDAPTQLTLSAETSLETFYWFVGLQTEHQVVPDDAAERSLSSEARFLSGTLAMYLNSRRGVPAYREIDDFAWDVAPLPSGRGRNWQGVLHSDGYCMAGSAGDKAAAWQFIAFANSATGQALIAKSGRTVPSRIDTANSEAFLDPILPPENSVIYIETVDHLQTVPTIANWSLIEELASNEIAQAFYGYRSVDDAAVRADQITQTYFTQADSKN